MIGSTRARLWRGVFAARNELQHAYPDVRAAASYRAAVELATDLPGYVRAYAAWMRRLGFGSAES